MRPGPGPVLTKEDENAMSKSVNRWNRDMELEWPELDLPNRWLVHIAKRDRANMVTPEATRLSRRLCGRRRP
jgi:hypothetical protein